MDGPTVAVAQHLDLDVARLREIFLEIKRLIAEGALDSARAVASVAMRSSGRCATFMPRPPPPAAALRRTGKPSACATDIASSSEDKPPLDPGTTGMPNRSAVRLASILSPMSRICAGFGPMK